MFDVLIFNVELGQCAFVYPHDNPEYGMMIDIGKSQSFNPLDFLLYRGYIHKDQDGSVLGNLLLTNYDHDHYAGLPDLGSRNIKLRTVNFPKNLSSSEIDNLKPVKTEALNHLLEIKDTYIHPAPYYQPPYSVETFYLEQSDFDAVSPDTNNLSQLAIITYGPLCICFPGDLRKPAWEKILLKPDWLMKLGKVNVLVAPHHGREDGHHPDIFGFLKPECIIISDESIKYETQEDMSSTYSNHIDGPGIVFNGNSLSRKKVLTTRRDGHIIVQANGPILNFGSFNA